MPYFIFDMQLTPRRIQVGDRPLETDDARTNWTWDEGQKGYTKHHMVPWNKLKAVCNQALSDLQVGQNDGLWKKIIGTAYAGGHAGSFQRALQDAADHLKGLLKTLKKDYTPPAAAELDTETLPRDYRLAMCDLTSYFCWMPGNFFLGPTPQSRLDDPGADGFDWPPKHQGGKLVLALESLYKAIGASDWGQVASLLDVIKQEGVSKRTSAIFYDPDEWKRIHSDEANRDFFRKKY